MTDAKQRTEETFSPAVPPELTGDGAQLVPELSISMPFAPGISDASDATRPLTIYNPQPLSLPQPTAQSSRLQDAVHKLDFPMNNNFVGRQDILREIKVELIDGEQKPNSSRAFAIYGTAGVGKTQTALEFAYKHKGSFPSILWASAETRYKLLQSLSDYSIMLGLVSDSTGPTTNADTLMHWYQTTSKSHSATDHDLPKVC